MGRGGAFQQIARIDMALMPIRAFDADDRLVVVSHEVLARPVDAQGRAIRPDHLVAQLEREGAIAGFDLNMLRKAALAVTGDASLHLAVNVSPLSVVLPRFQKEVGVILRDMGMNAHRLSFEVLETQPLALAEARDFIRNTRGFGCDTGWDDCGVDHHVRIDHRRDLRARTVKIDASIIRGLSTSVAAQTAFAGIMHEVTMGGYKHVVAEGIEQGSMVAPLRKLGVTHFQGYFDGGQPQPYNPLREWKILAPQ